VIEPPEQDFAVLSKFACSCEEDPKSASDEKQPQRSRLRKRRGKTNDDTNSSRCLLHEQLWPLRSLLLQHSEGLLDLLLHGREAKENCTRLLVTEGQEQSDSSEAMIYLDHCSFRCKNRSSAGRFEKPQ